MFVLAFVACSGKLEERSLAKQKLSQIEETEVITLPMNEYASDPSMEFSGLAWYKDKLILLPQYPSKINGDGFLYIEKREIYNSIKNGSELNPQFLKVDLTGLEEYDSHGSGFEAIVFREDKVFVSIESMSFSETISIIVRGIIDSVNMSIDFNEDIQLKLPVTSGINNFSEEALFLADSSLIAIHELNSEKNSTAFKIPFDLSGFNKIDFPQINYRITDVSEVDDSGRFYVINYFWEGEDSKFPLDDKIAEKWGIGKSTLKYSNIERIVEFKINKNEIQVLEKAPIYLELKEYGRNWEGIVKLDSLGFLLVTDKFPKSILGYVSFDKEK